MPLLDIRNLTVEFATASGPFRAVDSVDFQVDAGEILSIVGESGSGKSVAMLAVMGLLPWTATITADRMAFEGRDLREIGALLQLGDAPVLRLLRDIDCDTVEPWPRDGADQE